MPEGVYEQPPPAGGEAAGGEGDEEAMSVSGAPPPSSGSGDGGSTAAQAPPQQQGQPSSRPQQGSSEGEWMKGGGERERVVEGDGEREGGGRQTDKRSMHSGQLHLLVQLGKYTVLILVPMCTPTENPLHFLRQAPQFQALRRVVQQNPSMLQALLQQIGQNNPQLLQVLKCTTAFALHVLTVNVYVEFYIIHVYSCRSLARTNRHSLTYSTNKGQVHPGGSPLLLLLLVRGAARVRLVREHQGVARLVGAHWRFKLPLMRRQLLTG